MFMLEQYVFVINTTAYHLGHIKVYNDWPDVYDLGRNESSFQLPCLTKS